MFFFIKHARKIQIVILSICFALSIVYNIFVNFSVLPFVFSLIITLAFNLLGIIIINNIARKKCIGFLNSCEPDEYFQFVKALYNANPKSLVYAIDYCAMLINLNISNTQTAKSILEHFDLTPFSSKVFYPLMAIYYNNLYDIYISLEEFDKAFEAYENELKYFKLPESTGYKPHLFSTLALTTADVLCRKGDYENAIIEIEKHDKNNLFEKVAHAFGLGMIYIGMGTNEKAIEQFEYVIENG
ncbi:MAG: hypothetical protein IJW10_04270, partial [Clostridia bacterium]|nr:hypothetical protein [Clostridia bacterium]